MYSLTLVLTSVDSAHDIYINRVSKKCSVARRCFLCWKGAVIGKVRSKLKQSFNLPFNNVLNKDNVKCALAQLQDDFAVIPVDKPYGR